ncbi:hypothetical protein DRR62_04775 [Escherichia coli]|nr:hypothetical protein [Escherichia coli]
MKLSTCCAALLLALASPAVLAAPGSCERIQSDISQRISNWRVKLAQQNPLISARAGGRNARQTAS